MKNLCLLCLTVVLFLANTSAIAQNNLGVRLVTVSGAGNRTGIRGVNLDWFNARGLPGRSPQ